MAISPRGQMSCADKKKRFGNNVFLLKLVSSDGILH
jgi:hypothetical protein